MITCEAEMRNGMHSDLPIFTAFVPNSVVEHWLSIYQLVLEYHEEYTLFSRFIVQEWRQRYPSLAVGVSDKVLSQVGAIISIPSLAD